MVNKPAIRIETTHLCDYGCGQLANYINKSNRFMCEEYSTKCPIIKKRNSEGLKKAHKTTFNSKEVYRNLPQETKERMKWNKGNFKADFSYKGRGSHKIILIQERGHQCEQCKNTEWNGIPITLELEHMDGDHWNNNRENLKLLCPNCHSQTKTWRRRNKRQKIVSDDEIIQKIKLGLNPRQILLSVGLTPKGGNYERVGNLITITQNTKTHK